MKNYYFILFVLIGCQSEELQRSGKTREGRPDAESWNAIITLTNKGAKRGVIRSGHLEKYNSNEFILLDQNVDANFFNKEEEYTTNLKSHKAEIDEEDDFLVAIGDVIVVTDSGVTLFTDTLSWDNLKERIFTSDSVIFVTEKKDTLYGIGFESDIELNNWKILQPTGVFYER